jgi:TRAP-type C4-dicarboxylate transport system permease small subunit
MAIVNAVHKLSDRLDNICAALCIICLCAMVLLTGAQIICRMYFTALAWSEELARYLLVWSTFLGAGCVYKKLGHISVTLVQGLFPPAVRAAMQITVHVLCGAFFLMATYYGIKYMGLQGRQLSAAMRIPMSWIYLAIPLGCGIMALHVLDFLLRMLRGNGTRQKPAGSAQ